PSPDQKCRISLESWRYFISVNVDFSCHFLGSTNAERTGGGIGESFPFTAFQMISLKTRSSARSSASSRSSFNDASAPKASLAFLAFKSIRAGWAANGARSAVGANEAAIGRAAASNWLMGSRPRINSIVRSIDEVLYIVESTECFLM